MKKKLVSIISVLALAAIPVAMFAQSSLSATAKAEIRKPLVIIEDPLIATGTNALDFGIVNTSATAGTVVLTTSNAESVTGGVSLSNTATKVASFQISGTAGKTYAITLITPLVTINGTTGAAFSSSATMKVNTFTVRPASVGGDALVGMLDGTTGIDKFVVGGTLHVAANQPEGQYAGTLSVSAAYN